MKMRLPLCTPAAARPFHPQSNEQEAGSSAPAPSQARAFLSRLLSVLFPASEKNPECISCNVTVPPENGGYFLYKSAFYFIIIDNL